MPADLDISGSSPPSPMGARAGGWANDPPAASGCALPDSGLRTEAEGPPGRDRGLHLSSTLESLLLAAAKARLTIIETLQNVMTSAEDPVEQRRAASILLRATQAPLIPIHHDPITNLYSVPTRAEPRRETPAPPRPIPAPRFTPHRDLPPASIVHDIATAIQRNNIPEPNTGLATLAAFLDHDATISGEEFPNPLLADDDQSPADLLDELADAAADSCLRVPLQSAWTGQTKVISADDHHAVIEQTFQYTPDFRPILRFTLERRPDSRHPDAFLITNITDTRRDTS